MLWILLLARFLLCVVNSAAPPTLSRTVFFLEFCFNACLLPQGVSCVGRSTIVDLENICYIISFFFILFHVLTLFLFFFSVFFFLIFAAHTKSTCNGAHQRLAASSFFATFFNITQLLPFSEFFCFLTCFQCCATLCGTE